MFCYSWEDWTGKPTDISRRNSLKCLLLLEKWLKIEESRHIMIWTDNIPPQASDPDVGEEGQLVYSLSAVSPYFDVEPSTGLVYVVSAVGLAEQLAKVKVEVKATDPRGLNATTTVEVSVEGWTEGVHSGGGKMNQQF